MRFLNPAGLWLLLGIPILIIIYLIKSQHEERPVSSTYIWKLSERFMKKRLPLQKIRRILLFLMQLLMVFAAAMLASRPAVVDGESKEYIAVLDMSASMQTKDEEGISRFDYAKEEIEELAEQIRKGHTLSIVAASEDAAYMVKASDSVSEVKHALKELSCGEGSCDALEVIDLVQLECERNANVEVIFYTDTSYEKTENLKVVNLNKGEWNVQVQALKSQINGADTLFTGTIISRNEKAEVVVGLKINGEIVDAQQVFCEKDVATEVTFTAENLLAYDTAELYVEEEDGLSLDNSYTVCMEKEQTYDVLLISQAPMYLKSVLQALGNCEVSVVKDISIAELSNFDLYIFDGIAPEKYPTDGAVLVFGTELLPEGLVAGEKVATGEKLTINNNVASPLYEGLVLTDTEVINYAPLSAGAEWEPLLYCGESPVMMTTKGENGLRFSLISFNLHDSNLPLQMEYGVLMKNLVRFSVPSLLSNLDYEVGETVEITVLPGAQALRVEHPHAAVKELSVAKDTVGFVPEKTGVYTVVMEKGLREESAKFAARIPDTEAETVQETELKLEIVKKKDKEKTDAASEVWFWIAAVFLVILLLEWGWYYREQY